MPAKSEKQKRFFGAAMGAKKGQSNVSGEAKKVAKEMPKKEIKKFLKTEDVELEESNSKKTPPPHGMRRPKATNEKRAFGKAKEAGIAVRGKRNPVNLPSDWDDKNIEADWKKQNKSKKPSRDTIRKGEEDEQSISKQMKKTGKAIIKGPQVKERKKFAPATKVEDPKKGKGSYNRKETFDENTDIAKFIDCILTKNYASANKYIKQAVESKIQAKIEQELSTPLF